MLTGLTEVVILQYIHIANYYVVHPELIKCYVNLWRERKLPKMARSGSLAPGFVNNYEPAEIGEGNGTPLQYSCLENPRDGGAWWAAIYGVTHRQT